MRDKLADLEYNWLARINQCASESACLDIKQAILGKKSEFSALLRSIGQLPQSERATAGHAINQVKASIMKALATKQAMLAEKSMAEALAADRVDVTQPVVYERGQHHPITQMMHRVCDFFTRLGYSIKTGPEIETDFYNFQALNIPPDHPARDMHDTFYSTTDQLLRTHMSPVQIRTMETIGKSIDLPIQIIAPGRVYRRDSDRSHSVMFHQLEGLVVDNAVSFADLKALLTALLRDLFGADKSVRFRPSYFPFTEPSAEVDILWDTASGPEWLEILGCGLVNNQVFKAVGLPETTQGFAFGVGIDRLVMLYYGIPAIKRLYDNDQRFLVQF